MTRTGFDRYFARRMKNPRFATEYARARAKIDATDTLIRALETERKRSGISKAALARRIRVKPEIVRRLLTDMGGNPTIGTVLKVVSALGLHLELVARRLDVGTRLATSRPIGEHVADTRRRVCVPADSRPR